MKRNHLMIGMSLVVALVLAGGFFLAKSALDALANPNAQPSPTRPPKSSPSPSLAPSPTPSPTPPPSPSPSPTKASPKPSPKSECYRLRGKNLPRSQVEAALEKAADSRLWTETPIYRTSRELVKAIAWQESGWQSACMAKDGGIGTMQLMPGTVDLINVKLDAPLDPYTLSGNTKLGSFYLQWLTKWLGDMHFGGNYSLDPAPCANHKPCLLNAVISAYNAGHGATDEELGDGDEVNYPNVRYVDNVREIMTWH